MSRLENVADIYPVTPAQAGMLYYSLRHPDDGVYFEQVRYDLAGELDIAKLKQAWALVFERHPMLRTIFVWESVDNPLQVVRQTVELPWEELDWREKPLGNVEAELDQLSASYRQRPFDFTKAPIARLVLVRLEDELTHFIWNSHHILLDGWSFVRVLTEAFDLYEQLVAGQRPTLKAARPFKQYIAWLKKQDAKKAEAYWREQLAGFDAPTALQVDKKAPETAISHGRLTKTLSAEATQTLKALAQQERLTLNTLILGAWGILLSRYSGQDDVVFGSLVSGRPAELPQVEEMIGMFINTLPLRLRPESEQPLLPWLKTVQAQQLEMRQYEYTALADIQRWSEIPAGQLLFESIIVFENYPTEPMTEERSLKLLRPKVVEQSNYPLVIEVNPAAELQLMALYNQARFDAATIERLLGHLLNLLTNITADPTQKVGELEILSAAEKQQILVEWNQTAKGYEVETTLDVLFDRQVAQAPEQTALIYEGEEMSYAELQQKANQLAHYLIAAGVGRETPVGIAMNRSFEMMIGLLATVKAGGVYVPLDPNYPDERLTLMVGDANVKLILSTDQVQKTFPACEADVVYLDRFAYEQYPAESPQVENTPEQTLFITFTSGSTGRPKGVQGHHRGVVNRCQWQWEAYPLLEEEIVSQKTTLNFVDHLWEIWGALLQGAPLLLIPEDVIADAPRFLKTLADYEIQRIVLVPSYIRVLLDTYPDLAERLPQLKYWTFSGEGVSRGLADRFREQMPHAVILNFYGMSEVTLDATTYDDRWGIPCETIPIGRPIGNMKVYVLDQEKRPVPVGVPGEIYVSGVGLSQGYYGRPDLTAQSFFDNPFETDEPYTRLYKSGDLGRWLPSGDVEYIGRVDNQVKIRGFRVEPGEIEAVIRSHPAVKDVLVVAKQFGHDTRLVAYILTTENVSDGELKELIRKKLPAYMVPAVIQHMAEFPRLPNGKVNRKALPEIQTAARGKTAVPITQTQKQMAAIWQTLIGIERVGLDDNFFDIGGHSLLALRLASQIKKEMGINLPLATLLQAPTVRQLATAVDQLDESDTVWSLLVPIQPEGARPPLYCVHGAGGNVLIYRDLAEHLKDFDQPVYGLQSQGLDGIRPLHQSIEEMAQAYAAEIVRHRPEGPYLLAGYCMGGTVALEIGRFLAEAGHEVGLVGLLETYNWQGRPPVSTQLKLTYNAQRVWFHWKNFAQLDRDGKSAFLGEKWHVLKERMALWSGQLKQKLGSQNGTHRHEDEQDVDQALAKVWANNDRVSFAYDPRPFEGKLTQILPAEDYAMYQNPGCGWDDYAAEGVEQYRMRSYPAGMLIEPYVAQLAEMLNESIEKSLAGEAMAEIQ